jgi:hypothetical protein
MANRKPFSPILDMREALELADEETAIVIKIIPEIGQFKVFLENRRFTIVFALKLLKAVINLISEHVGADGLVDLLLEPKQPGERTEDEEDTGEEDNTPPWLKE